MKRFRIITALVAALAIMAGDTLAQRGGRGDGGGGNRGGGGRSGGSQMSGQRGGGGQRSGGQNRGFSGSRSSAPNRSSSSNRSYSGSRNSAAPRSNSVRPNRSSSQPSTSSRRSTSQPSTSSQGSTRSPDVRGSNRSSPSNQSLSGSSTRSNRGNESGSSSNRSTRGSDSSSRSNSDRSPSGVTSRENQNPELNLGQRRIGNSDNSGGDRDRAAQRTTPTPDSDRANRDGSNRNEIGRDAERNREDRSIGDRDRNGGDRDIGDRDRNDGDRSIGDRDRNDGDRNFGDRDRNDGDRNFGDRRDRDGDWGRNDGDRNGDWRDRDNDRRWGGWNGRHHHRHRHWNRGFWSVGLFGFNPWFGGYGYGYGGYGLGSFGLFGSYYGYDPYGYGYGGGFGGYSGFGLGYRSGYVSYYNPYCEAPVYFGTTVVDYTQPLVVTATETGQLSEDDSDPAVATAMADFDSARQAFYNGDYDAARTGVESAIRQLPDDGLLHEFRALVLFAQGDYQGAAGTIHSVLAGGPGWDWETLRSLYPDVATYTVHLRALEDYALSNEQAAEARFLLGYHYLSGGHTDASLRQFQRVLAIQPNDTVAQQLVKSMSPESVVTAESATTPPAAEPILPAPPTGPESVAEPELPAVSQTTARLPAGEPLTSLDAGSWTAARPDGSTFSLTLKDDGTFTWDFTGDGQTNSLAGTYSVADDLLVLEPNDGGAMVGRLTQAGEDGFHFQLIGAPPDDEGLTFQK